MPGLMGTKKRRHMPNELFGRFSSKSDFVRYFREVSKYCSRNLTLSVQCNFTCHRSTCSIKTF